MTKPPSRAQTFSRRAAEWVAAATGNACLRARLGLLAGLCALIAVGTASALVLGGLLAINPPTLRRAAGPAQAWDERCANQRQTPPSCGSLTLYFELDASSVTGTRFARSRGEPGFAALRQAVSQGSLLRVDYYEADCGLGPTCWPIAAFDRNGPLFVTNGDQRRRAALPWLVGICALSVAFLAFYFLVRRAGKSLSARS